MYAKYSCAPAERGGFKLLAVKRRVHFPRDENEKPIVCVGVCSGPGESVLLADPENDAVRRLTDSPPSLNVVYKFACFSSLTELQ